jgi:uncharacterized integral membrane protein (TIGR00698 family)
MFRRLGELLPGVVLAAAVMLAAFPLADALGRGLLRLQGLDPAGRASPLPGVSIAILLGLLVGNVVPLPAASRAGVRFAMSNLLRAGIVLVGIKLSLSDVLRLGVWGVPVVVAAIAAGLAFVSWVNRAMGLPPRLGTLIAVGTGICGMTAIVSTAPVIEAEEREVAYAVANVALFGLLGMLVYPYLAPLLLRTSEQIGLFLGTAIHDTSQVVGAALAYRQMHHDEVAFQAATITKLTRNLFLAAVIPLAAWNHRRSGAATTPGSVARPAPLVPLFVAGFVGMSVLRSLGDAALPGGRALGMFGAEAWKSLTSQLGDVWGSRILLGTALAAVGLNTRFETLRGVGPKPFAVGFAGALLVGAVGLGMSLLVGRFVRL